jgi:hypothetical protein
MEGAPAGAPLPQGAAVQKRTSHPLTQPHLTITYPASILANATICTT